MKYCGACFEIVIWAQEQFQGKDEEEDHDLSPVLLPYIVYTLG